LKREKEQTAAQLNQLQGDHDQTVERLRGENEQLKGSLKVKSNGNVMMNALMRGFKQKIIDEKRKQD
jgi:predicted RNase H-like nuclease (RuvC/YqgF family)